MSKTVKENFRDYLLANAGVSALLGSRLFPASAKKTYGTIDPYSVYTFVSQDPVYSHNMASAGAVSVGAFRTYVVQIDIFSKSAVTAENTGDAISSAVEGKKFSQASTVFGAVLLDTEFDNFEDVTRADGSSGLFRKTLQLRLEIEA